MFSREKILWKVFWQLFHCTEEMPKKKKLAFFSAFLTETKSKYTIFRIIRHV